MLDNVKVILASGSPRRRELLSRIGMQFEIVTSSVEEKTAQAEPDRVVKELSYIKAEDVFRQIIGSKDTVLSSGGVSAMIIGADTVVSKGGRIMGKPQSEEEAFDMIYSIQGSTHQVYTGVTIFVYHADTGRTESKSFSECTDVTVFPMTDAEIKGYIATGDCMDKAGGYGIQGSFGVFVQKINGDYNNVVGLPVARLYQELKEISGDLGI